MNRYLEALERLAMPDDLHIKECERLGIGLTEDYDLLEQYILKTQEPKKYLRWEDLEFKEEKQIMLVLLNGEKYILNYHRTINKTFCYNRCFAQLIKLDVIGANITIANSDFFNNLHLEVVENE